MFTNLSKKDFFWYCRSMTKPLKRNKYKGMKYKFLNTGMQKTSKQLTIWNSQNDWKQIQMFSLKLKLLKNNWKSHLKDYTFVSLH